jgi:hypothetical protein
MGAKVDVSMGTLCVDVSVGRGRGVKVCDAVTEAVRVGMEVKVSDAGGTVDVSATTAEGDAVGLLLLKLHARFAAIKRMRK